MWRFDWILSVKSLLSCHSSPLWFWQAETWWLTLTSPTTVRLTWSCHRYDCCVWSANTERRSWACDGKSLSVRCANFWVRGISVTASQNKGKKWEHKNFAKFKYTQASHCRYVETIFCFVGYEFVCLICLSNWVEFQVSCTNHLRLLLILCAGKHGG